MLIVQADSSESAMNSSIMLDLRARRSSFHLSFGGGQQVMLMLPLLSG